MKAEVILEWCVHICKSMEYFTGFCLSQHNYGFAVFAQICLLYQSTWSFATFLKKMILFMEKIEVFNVVHYAKSNSFNDVFA